ncbi:Glutathione-binding protein GsiB [Roseovarius sp. EC-HK134]|jgi:peptide/nickel transport system substrate-binding protein|uniref:Glutathione-binding protein GsiB n=1 Tax=Roseovarius mucosus TaxID=215743 RepID=A0A1V0RT06_9RHOB|nr:MULTISPECIES: peptide ABC transporter substrate-binding protein [Roseovarius]ARE84826.1 glutathione-binding protein GsiB [Roseovarius mucosus]AWZ20966.1 Peptide/opine/nickel uptake family ABC transporter, periplasmic substrate-binding protein [Roseovarius sp. AK1035]EDM32844.1 peptide/opine/nickel uptake family ABC transporter, periplasmic substrate-binding protein [Roseovarius sp. TM1035]VVT21825.1 Glutathione-binding protein GsiB [Roseovarius sp. EC-SD190]VVT24209.1 Glutathione-binding pr|tara:strand:- start:74 stop:1774 length:1701 start_codon:yes stop_codon:yes gene_type:complete
MTLKSLLLGATAATSLASVAMAERGADGHVNLIYWQAPSIMNPYLSGGTKEVEAASLVIEPLGRYNTKGEMIPYLAEEIPTVANGGVSEDLTSITWKIKPGITWSDGTPFTANDVKFTAEYCMHPEGGCAQLGKYEGVSSVEVIDDLTVKVNFSQPTPVPYGPFMGGQAPIIQAAQFADCLGAKAQECADANFAPIGTGPFKVDEFRPNDVISLSANPNYRDPAKPRFATMTFKGGGDATAAGRAVLETGEFDYAWNLQLAPDVIANMEAAGKGVAMSAFGTLVERIEMNMTDPSPDLPEGERATAKHPHPILTDLRVRKALSMAIDRALLTEIGYGKAGRPTCNLVPAPEIFASDNTDCLTQDIEGAKALLEEAGWTVGAGGIREKDGKKLSLLFQTSTNAVRQDFQALIKQWWSEIGVETELRNISASVFFGSDPGSPDTFPKFYADVEMYANNFDGTDPQSYLAGYTCEKAPRPETQWQGENINRFCDPAYDALVKELGRTAELDKRGEIAKKLNDMLTKDSYTIVPLVDRGRVSARSNSLGGVELNTWDTELWNAADWFRIK